MNAASLQALIAALEEQRSAFVNKRVVAGFDGFVDELIDAVDQREDAERYQKIDSMARFGEMITAASGRSSLTEIQIRSTDAGGCSVNLSDGLNHLGVAVDYYGTLGQPIHPAFHAFSQECRSCQSWLDGHGLTLALEFSDGKYMLASMSDLHRFTTAVVKEQVEQGDFKQRCIEADVIVLNNWTLYPHMTEVWHYLAQEVFSQLPKRIPIFIDLVNPSSRSRQDIFAMMECLKQLQQHCDCILGVNLNEADLLAGLIGDEEAHAEPEAVLKQIQSLREYLRISEVVAHGVKVNCVAGDDYTASGVVGPYCEAPLKSTGAGDRFNAGYCLGLIAGVEPEQRLQLGVASSGVFIRQARSASFDETVAFLRDWSEQIA